MFSSRAAGNPLAVQQPSDGRFAAVFFDRDGTLIEDVPYNGDPDRVRPVSGAREALDRLRAVGLRIGVVTNQSGLARGRFDAAALARVHDRIEDLLGPFDTWQVCPHVEADGCLCRKPAPGLVLAAAAAMGVPPHRCVVVGDIGSDMVAAGAAGASGILVPTPVTRPEEVAAAPAAVGDLRGAVDLILRRQRLVRPADGGVSRNRPRRVLVARADSAGDVLLTGPAIRAVRAGADAVTLLCGPRGRAAAELLPGVDEIIEWRLPWIDPAPESPGAADIERLTARLATVDADEAIIFTSFHQSALPLALMLRMAGVPRISAISDDYPGALLDIRHRAPLGIPEVERALSLAAAAGFPVPPGDDTTLRLLGGLDDVSLPAGYVVVHPGASVPARACPPETMRGIVTALVAAGRRVVVTGGPADRELSARVARDDAVDLGGKTTMFSLASVIAGADCLVVGNTGPAHLAAAVRTPVVSLFAPTVPFGQWGPHGVPYMRLGDPVVECRHTRATRCPVAGHPCLSTVDPLTVVEAVRLLGGAP